LYRTEVVPGGGGLQIRLIRDINLSAKHCLKGLFLKVKLFTAYLFGLNYKPFGKCVFGDKKTSPSRNVYGEQPRTFSTFPQVLGADCKRLGDASRDRRAPDAHLGASADEVGVLFAAVRLAETGSLVQLERDG